MDSVKERIYKAADAVRPHLGGRVPQVGIVLGSGLGKLVDKIEDQVVIPYRDIPGFPVSTAIGHKGNFIFGKLGGKDVLAMQGRIHYYEGYDMSEVILPIRVMKVLGISYLFVSNAAGALNFDYNVGDLMIIRDHINLQPNPLIGPNLDEFGPRFPDMTHPYDLGLIAKSEEIASELGIPLHKGVYVGVTGACYETPAEMRFFQMVGADAVGMSTIPEVIAARHSQIPVFGMSVITDASLRDIDSDYKLDGESVVKAADAAADKMTLLFSRLIASI
ncbi:MAG: purine-nucleoside phosphorylase [Bacteroidales bacterium]|nr:purine-nucleoside phosphorylase [Bacteroidales bacterium]